MALTTFNVFFDFNNFAKIFLIPVSSNTIMWHSPATTPKPIVDGLNIVFSASDNLYIEWRIEQYLD